MTPQQSRQLRELAEKVKELEKIILRLQKEANYAQQSADAALYVANYCK